MGDFFMDKKEAFKNFARLHPELVSYIKSGEMSWQKFYEMYDLYGEDEQIWSDYQKTEPKVETVKKENKITGMADVLTWLKMIDLDSLQEGVSSLQRVLGVFQDLSGNKTTTNNDKGEYKPRPLYRHFED